MTNTITYPQNPSIGDQFTVGGTRKEWDGTRWRNVSFGNHENRLEVLEYTKGTTFESLTGTNNSLRFMAEKIRTNEAEAKLLGKTFLVSRYSETAVVYPSEWECISVNSSGGVEGYDLLNDVFRVSKDSLFYEFQLVGDVSPEQLGETDTPQNTDLAFSRAVKFLPERTLVLGPSYDISQPIEIPDVSEETIACRNGRRVTITQTTNNTPIFRKLVTAARYGFSICYGGILEGRWSSAQPVSNTDAIVVALGSTQNIADGLYNWKAGTIINENGYAAVDVLSATKASNFVLPIWGFDATIQSQSQASGPGWGAASPGPSGSPRGRIPDFYANAASGQTDVLVIKKQHSLKLGNVEINNAQRRSVLVESCRNVVFDVLRFENCVLSGSDELFSGSGAETYITVGQLELDTITTESNTDVYGLRATNGASIKVADRISIRQCEGTGAGTLKLFRPTTDGRIMLPPCIENDNSDPDRVRLYEVGDAPNISFSSIDSTDTHWYEGLVADLSFVPALVGKDSVGIIDSICPTDGFVVELHCYLSAAVTAGLLDVRVSINGNLIGSGAFKASSTANQKFSTYATFGYDHPNILQTHKVSRGDNIRVVITTNSAFVGGGNLSAKVVIAESTR